MQFNNNLKYNFCSLKFPSQCEFSPLSSEYSSHTRNLVNSILQKDANARPSAEQLCDEILPQMMLGAEQATAADDHNATSRPRSVVYKCSLTFDSMMAINLPPKVQLEEIAVSDEHCLALTKGECARATVNFKQPSEHARHAGCIISLLMALFQVVCTFYVFIFLQM